VTVMKARLEFAEPGDLPPGARVELALREDRLVILVEPGLISPAAAALLSTAVMVTVAEARLSERQRVLDEVELHYAEVRALTDPPPAEPTGRAAR